MVGRLIRPIVTTVAPTMPVDAASSAPTSSTAITSPPGLRPNRPATDSSKASARRERSSITPMKMNSGTATSVSLPMTPNRRFG